MLPSRFLHPYYIFNTLLPLCYVLLRVNRLSPKALSAEDMFGISREHQIYICLSMMLFVRLLSAPTVDAYLSSAFMFTRVCVLVCSWQMDQRYAALFAALWALLYLVYPQPRYRFPSSIVTLNDVSFRDRISRNDHRTIYVLWCHAVWSSRCSQLAPVLANLAGSYQHDRIRFATLDVSKYPALADSLQLSTSPASKQLPAVICFKQGREACRLPVVDSRGNVPVKYSRGFTAAQVAEALALDGLLNTAEEWEAQARERKVGKKQL